MLLGSQGALEELHFKAKAPKRRRRRRGRKATWLLHRQFCTEIGFRQPEHHMRGGGSDPSPGLSGACLCAEVEELHLKANGRAGSSGVGDSALLPSR